MNHAVEDYREEAEDVRVENLLDYWRWMEEKLDWKAVLWGDWEVQINDW
jgi:hypothetical protein